MKRIFQTLLIHLCFAIAIAAFSTSQSSGQSRVSQTLDFESINVGATGYINGSDLAGASAFDVDGFRFSNTFDNTWGPYWTGFAFSNHSDNLNGGPTNQYSSFAGGGAGNSSNFAVGYMESMYYGNDWTQADNLRDLPTIALPSGVQVESLQITNTTYAALSIAIGDQFTDPFGPGDFFDVSIYGIDADGAVIAPVTFRLADYISATSSSDGFILSQWETIDLQNLANAESLHFAMTTTAFNAWGPVTPLSFAIDNLSFSTAAVPEPSSMALCALLLAGGVAARRKKLKKSQLSSEVDVDC